VTPPVSDAFAKSIHIRSLYVHLEDVRMTQLGLGPLWNFEGTEVWTDSSFYYGRTKPLPEGWPMLPSRIPKMRWHTWADVWAWLKGAPLVVPKARWKRRTPWARTLNVNTLDANFKGLTFAPPVDLP
jgi:hypothetical protein